MGGPYPLGHPATLGLAALISPDDAWPQDLVLFVQQDDAMHLARETDTAHIGRLDIVAHGTNQAGSNGSYRGLPPCCRVLLGPTRPGMHQRIIDKCRGEHLSIFRREEGRFDTRSAEVDTKESMHIGFPLHRFFATCNDVLDVGFVQAQHKACRIGAKGPDAYAILYASVVQCSLLCLLATQRSIESDTLQNTVDEMILTLPAINGRGFFLHPAHLLVFRRERGV